MYNINPLLEKIKNLFLSIGERFNKYFNYDDVKVKLLNFTTKPKSFKENKCENNKIPKESYSAAALAVLVLDHGIELMNFAKNKVSPTQETILQKE